MPLTVPRPMSRLLILLAAFAAFAVGAVEIAAGATRNEVLRVLGKPKYTLGAGNKQTLGYDGLKIFLVDGVVVGSETAAGAPTGAPAVEANQAEGDDIRQRRRQEKAYLDGLRDELLGETRDESKRVSRELKEAELNVHRLKRKSPGLPPAKPVNKSDRKAWNKYLKALAAHEKLADKMANALRSAEEERDQLRTEHEGLVKQIEEVERCDQKELYGKLVASGWKQPALAVGHVGLIGKAVVAKRLDPTRSYWTCEALQTNSTVLACEFEGTAETIDEQELFPGVVEVVGLHDSKELGKNLFEIRPYVRDVSTGR